jgi:hypothetical protein
MSAPEGGNFPARPWGAYVSHQQQYSQAPILPTTEPQLRKLFGNFMERNEVGTSALAARGPAAPSNMTTSGGVGMPGVAGASSASSSASLPGHPSQKEFILAQARAQVLTHAQAQMQAQHQAQARAHASRAQSTGHPDSHVNVLLQNLGETSSPDALTKERERIAAHQQRVKMSTQHYRYAQVAAAAAAAGGSMPMQQASQLWVTDQQQGGGMPYSPQNYGGPLGAPNPQQVAIFQQQQQRQMQDLHYSGAFRKPISSRRDGRFYSGAAKYKRGTTSNNPPVQQDASYTCSGAAKYKSSAAPGSPARHFPVGYGLPLPPTTNGYHEAGQPLSMRERLYHSDGRHFLGSPPTLNLPHYPYINSGVRPSAASSYSPTQRAESADNSTCKSSAGSKKKKKKSTEDDSVFYLGTHLNLAPQAPHSVRHHRSGAVGQQKYLGKGPLPHAMEQRHSAMGMSGQPSAHAKGQPTPAMKQQSAAALRAQYLMADAILRQRQQGEGNFRTDNTARSSMNQNFSERGEQYCSGREKKSTSTSKGERDLAKWPLQLQDNQVSSHPGGRPSGQPMGWRMSHLPYNAHVQNDCGMVLKRFSPPQRYQHAGQHEDPNQSDSSYSQDGEIAVVDPRDYKERLALLRPIGAFKRQATDELRLDKEELDDEHALLSNKKKLKASPSKEGRHGKDKSSLLPAAGGKKMRKPGVRSSLVSPNGDGKRSSAKACTVMSNSRCEPANGSAQSVVKKKLKNRKSATAGGSDPSSKRSAAVAGVDSRAPASTAIKSKKARVITPARRLVKSYDDDLEGISSAANSEISSQKSSAKARKHTKQPTGGASKQGAAKQLSTKHPFSKSSTKLAAGKQGVANQSSVVLKRDESNEIASDGDEAKEMDRKKAIKKAQSALNTEPVSSPVSPKGAKSSPSVPKSPLSQHKYPLGLMVKVIGGNNPAFLGHIAVICGQPENPMGRWYKLKTGTSLFKLTSKNWEVVD